jgi:hypothetical protein
LASAIAQFQNPLEDDAELARVLSEIEGLSDEEVEKLLGSQG